jgi:HemY protein
LATELVPAAVVAARLATRLGDPKRATKVLETTWKIEPHPDIAGAYMDVRSGESGRDRLKRVSHLAKIRANHIEGRLAVARAAIDAQDWPAAREELKGILATQPTGRAFVLMAEVEEAEHSDIGRARDWLSRAVRAPRDPAWTADGYVFDHWEPVSPISGRIDAFEWKVPVDRLEAVDDGAEDVAAIRDVSPASAGGQAVPVGDAGSAAPSEGAGRALSTEVRSVESAVLKQNGKDRADSEAAGAPAGKATPRQPDDPGPEPESEAEDSQEPSSGTKPRPLPS